MKLTCEPGAHSRFKDVVSKYFSRKEVPGFSRRQLLFGVFIGLVGVIVNLTPAGSALEEKFDLYWLFQLRGTVSALDEVVGYIGG